MILDLGSLGFDLTVLCQRLNMASEEAAYANRLDPALPVQLLKDPPGPALTAAVTYFAVWKFGICHGSKPSEGIWTPL